LSPVRPKEIMRRRWKRSVGGRSYRNINSHENIHFPGRVDREKSGQEGGWGEKFKLIHCVWPASVKQLTVKKDFFQKNTYLKKRKSTQMKESPVSRPSGVKSCPSTSEKEMMKNISKRRKSKGSNFTRWPASTVRPIRKKSTNAKKSSI